MQHFAGFERVDIAGIPVLRLRDERFKTFRFALFTRRPLDERTAARSMLPGLLLQGTARDPDRPAIARRMHGLYGAAVQPYTAKVGESHVLGFALDTVSGSNLPGQPDQLGDGLGLLADLLARPRLVDGGFPAEVFERERVQTAHAIRSIVDDKGAHAHERAIELACAGEPMARPDHGGLSAVESMDRADPEAARIDALTHGEMWAITMGDLPADAVLEDRIGAFLAELPARTAEPVPGPVLVAQRPTRELVERTELRQSKLVLVFRAPILEDPVARIGRALFVAMYGGGPSSRLFTEVREKRSLAYYASASPERHKGLLLVQVGLDGHRAGEAREECVRQLEILQRGEFEDRELEIARSTLLSGLQGVDDSIAGRVRFTAEQWLQQTDRAPEAVAELAVSVTREDVVAAAQGVWLDYAYLLTDDAGGMNAGEVQG